MNKIPLEKIILIRNAIILTAKKYGEYTGDGFRVDFAVLEKNLYKDERIMVDSIARNVKISEGNVFSFFGGQNVVKPELKSEDGIHWLYFMLAYRGQDVSLSAVKSQAEKLIRYLKEQNSKNPNEQIHLSIKLIAEELSRNIPFLEFYLKKSKKGMQTFIKEVVAGITKESLAELGSAIEQKIDENEKKSKDKISEAVAVPVQISDQDIDDYVRGDILKIAEEHGSKSGDGIRIILGELCNELAANSVAYQQGRGKYKGPARQYLLSRFKNILAIEYIDGKDWVRILPSGQCSDLKKEKKNSVQASKGLMEEVTKAPAGDETGNHGKGKSKEINTNQVLSEIHKLSDEKLIALNNVMLLIINIWGDDFKSAIKRMSIKHSENNDSGDLESFVDKVSLNALAVLVKNEKMLNALKKMTIRDLSDGVLEEVKTRKGIPEIPVASEPEIKSMIVLKSNFPYEQTVMTDTDYNDLDEWLPF